MTSSDRVHNIGADGHGYDSRVPAEVPRFGEAPAPRLPLLARDEQGLRDERVEDARAAGMMEN